MKYLFDTDHLSILQRGLGVEYEALRSRITSSASPDDFGLCVVSLHEQFLGAHTYLSRARSSAELVRGYDLMRRILSGFALTEVVPFDSTAASEFERLTKLNLRVATIDLRIASVALSRGLVLLTRNAKDFERIPGLSIEDWTVPTRRIPPK